MEHGFGGGDEEADEETYEGDLDDIESDDDEDFDDDEEEGEPKEEVDKVEPKRARKIDPESDDVTHAIDCPLDDTCACRDED